MRSESILAVDGCRHNHLTVGASSEKWWGVLTSSPDVPTADVVSAAGDVVMLEDIPVRFGEI